MIEGRRLCHLGVGIIRLESVEGMRLCAVTKDQRLLMIDAATGAITQQFALTHPQSDPERIALTPDASYLASAHAGHIDLVALESHKLLHRLSLPPHIPQVLAFDTRSRYLIVGTDTGRLWLWEREHKEPLTRLGSFPEHTHKMILPRHNFVSAIATLGNLCAAAGYGDSVLVLNLSTLGHSKRLYPGRSRINVMRFVDERHLLLGNSEGKVSKLFLLERRPHLQISASVGAIRHLEVLGGGRYALAASDQRYIALLDIEKMELIEAHHIVTAEKIADMALGADNQLYIAMQNGVIEIVALMPENRLREWVENRRYEAAYALCDAAPMLKESPWYEQLESYFENSFAKARTFLLKGNEAAARLLLDPFAKVASKKRRISELFYAFVHYPRLQFLLGNRRLGAAYGLMEQYPPLKHTADARRIEKEWDERFHDAQAAMLRQDEQGAKALLQPFATVAQKSALIRLVFELSQEIRDFSMAVATNDFDTLHRLSLRFPTLKALPSYQRVLSQSEGYVEQIVTALKADDFDTAASTAALLREVPHLKQQSERIERLIEQSRYLLEWQAEGKIRACLELLDAHLELSILPRAVLLESQWQQRMARCEKAAFNADAKRIATLMAPLMPLESRQEKVGILLRLAYRLQIEHARGDRERFERGVRNYLEIFGVDSEIRTLAGNPEALRSAAHQSRDVWLRYHARLPEFICETL